MTDTGNRYLILDSSGIPLAHARLESPPDAAVWQLRILSDGADAVSGHTAIQLVGMSDHSPTMAGCIIRQRGDLLAVEPTHPLGGKLRQNLRMPVQFDSFLYPISGQWQGRRSIQSRDLSCGGIAFFCTQTLEQGETAEIVIPVTTQPLILKVELLRPYPSSKSQPLYAAKFVDMTNDEESMVREAVFSLQLQKHNTNS